MYKTIWLERKKKNCELYTRKVTQSLMNFEVIFLLEVVIWNFSILVSLFDLSKKGNLKIL